MYIGVLYAYFVWFLILALSFSSGSEYLPFKWLSAFCFSSCMVESAGISFVGTDEIKSKTWKGKEEELQFLLESCWLTPVNFWPLKNHCIWSAFSICQWCVDAFSCIIETPNQNRNVCLRQRNAWCTGSVTLHHDWSWCLRSLKMRLCHALPATFRRLHLESNSKMRKKLHLFAYINLEEVPSTETFFNRGLLMSYNVLSSAAFFW